MHELYSPNDDQSIFNVLISIFNVLISILQLKLLKSGDLKQITTSKNQHTDPTVAPGHGPRTFSPGIFSLGMLSKDFSIADVSPLVFPQLFSHKDSPPKLCSRTFHYSGRLWSFPIKIFPLEFPIKNERLSPFRPFRAVPAQRLEMSPILGSVGSVPPNAREREPIPTLTR